VEQVNIQEGESIAECPSVDIAAYIDSELSPDVEIALERHLATCSVCTEELNLQKQFVNALNSSLGAAPEIPTDFTKRIMANAESNVSGLRRKSEWLNALLVCTALLFFVLFTLGANARSALLSFFDLFGQLAAVFNFVSHLLYDISVGMIVILRTIGAQPEFSLVGILVVIGLAAVLAYRFSPLYINNKKIDQLEGGNGF
jgi:hypothetical protein